MRISTWDICRMYQEEEIDNVIQEMNNVNVERWDGLDPGITQLVNTHYIFLEIPMISTKME